MGIADRLRDATRPTNEITQVFDPVRSTGAQGLHSASPDASAPAPVAKSGRTSLEDAAATLQPVIDRGRAPDAKPGQPTLEDAAARLQPVVDRSPGKKPAAYTTEPESIAKTYFIEDKGGERRYFDDYKKQGLAMRADEQTISTKREDLNTIKAMMDIAGARGWQTVDVKGTADFKREAWIEASTRGIEALGYRPSDPDRQEADRRRNERGLSNEVRAPLPPTPATPAAPVTPANPAASTLDPARNAATARAGVGTPEKPNEKAAHDHGKGHEKHGHEKGDHSPPTLADNRKTVQEARKELSPDGRLVLAAMGEKIDRQMNKHNTEAKAEMKAFVATELVKKERAEGPVVLSPEQKRTASAPEPAPARAEPAKAQEPSRNADITEPSRKLSR